MTVIYIDLLFLLNFVANYLLLLGAGRLAGAGLCRWRLAVGAAVGAIYAVAIFLPDLSWLSLWPCKIAAGILMAVCGYGGERSLVRVILLFFAVSAGLAGAVLGVELLGGTTLTLQSGVFYSQLDLRLLLLLFVLCYFVLSLLFRRLGRHTGLELVPVEILFPARAVKLTALRDTGHSLTDPVTNRPVVVAYWKDFAEFLPPRVDVRCPIESAKHCHETGIKGIRLIPYRAVGVEGGVLFALRTQGVLVNGRNVGALLVALSPTPVDDGGAYQALIGGI